MSTNLSSKQSLLRAALSMIGSAANEALDSILPKVNNELAKLFEDRNAQLTDGGNITFPSDGSSVAFTEALKITLNSQVGSGTPLVISLGSTTRAFSASGRMLYAVIDRTAGTATITADATTMPLVTSANQEVFLIAKRVDAGDGTKRLYFRGGFVMDAGQTLRLGAAGTSTPVLAKIYSLNQPTIGTSDTLIKFNSVYFDTNSAYNTSTGLYTVPFDGKYRVKVIVVTDLVNLATNQAVNAYVYKNGSFFNLIGYHVGTGAGINHVASGDAIVDCVAGDTLSVYINSAISITIASGAGSSYLEFEKVG